MGKSFEVKKWFMDFQGKNLLVYLVYHSSKVQTQYERRNQNLLESKQVVWFLTKQSLNRIK